MYIQVNHKCTFKKVIGERERDGVCVLNYSEKSRLSSGLELTLFLSEPRICTERKRILRILDQI